MWSERAGYGTIISFVQRASGAQRHGMTEFFARSALLDFFAAIDLDRRPEPRSEPLLKAPGSHLPR
jgi:hypothetical protein